MHSRVFPGIIGTAALALVVSAPASPRLYIFDCGVIHTTNGDAYSLKNEKMASTEMSSRASWSPIPGGP